MSRFLYRLGNLAYRKKWPFLAFWLVLLVALGGLAGAFAKTPASTFSIPGLAAVETQERMQELFPESGDAVSSPSGTVVLRAEDGTTLDDPAVAEQVNDLMAELSETGALTDTDALVNPTLAAQGLTAQMTPQLEAQGLPPEVIEKNIAAISPLSEDHTTGTVNIAFDAPSMQDISSEDKDKVTEALDNANSDTLSVTYSGNAFSGAGEMDMTSELIGLAVAAVVLLISFGSVVAAGMPLISAVIGVGIGIMGVQLATLISDDVNDMTPTLASMIGLAVGIDYALFIASRFRNELIALIKSDTGRTDLSTKELSARLREMSLEQRAHAMGKATGTAGSSVVFAGLTVLIALAALSIINIPFLTWMAGAAAITVAIAVLVALSFLPALLGLLGTRVFGGRVPGPTVPDPENDKPTMGLRWARQVGKRPWLALIAGVLALGLLAVPMANMRLAMPTDGSSAPGTPQREAYETIADSFGPGRNAPMIALVEAGDLPEQDRMPAFAQAVEKFNATEGVENAQIAGVNEEGTAAQVLITPTGGATDESTSQTLVDLRAAESEFAENTGAHYGITGATPIFDDMSDRLSDVLIPYIAIVLVLAFLVLMVVFRSIWVPLIAALGFGLSVAATFGVTVALFQEGWLGIVNDPQPLLSFLPIMLIGLVFGLAMDYQVFLVTRMREDYHHGKSAHDATESGFKHGARVVTAAALIMMSVFAAFALQDAAFIKTMGFALAAAVFFDAFVVRMMIIPATMYLLGDRAWKIPGWLDRILPNVDVEGEALREIKAPTNASASATESTESTAPEKDQ
ncbi:MMPL family transporter [Corynebacterium lowii]|uniref:Membrane protein YdfJ n=1 Tax=Corynebacterium lowii TaxID=1544413 RepID=A0A0Q1AH30_9CORY|nr:MMPL family transporter [Corynebacterium lowii]KQB85972.1 Membrane protein YdfJ [Corynebacterium lowii]MDP9850598.1 RND superfamily putative drug exporter [Corynebacterium lowii]